MSEPWTPGDGFGNQLIDDFGVIAAPSPEQAERARRYVAGQATGAEEARELFAMLGIEP